MFDLWMDVVRDGLVFREVVLLVEQFQSGGPVSLCNAFNVKLFGVLVVWSAQILPCLPRS